MTTKGVEGTGKSSVLAGCSYGEVNPRAFTGLFRIFEKFAKKRWRLGIPLRSTMVDGALTFKPAPIETR